MARNRRSGFTLVEATVIIVVVGLFAALVMPRVAAFTNSSRQHSFEQQFATLAAEGRERAIALAKPVDIEYDNSHNQFRLHTLDADGGDQYLQTLTVLPGLQTDRFLLGKQESDGSTWKLYFYPDGSSDGGGVQLDRQNYYLTLYVDGTTGYSTVVNEQLPDPHTFTWQGGDYIHRPSS